MSREQLRLIVQYEQKTGLSVVDECRRGLVVRVNGRDTVVSWQEVEQAV